MPRGANLRVTAIFLGTAQFVQIATGILSGVIVVFYLSKESFGFYSFVLSISAILAALSDFGLSTYFLKSQDEWTDELLAESVVFSAAIVTVIQLLLIVLTLVVYFVELDSKYFNVLAALCVLQLSQFFSVVRYADQMIAVKGIAQQKLVLSSASNAIKLISIVLVLAATKSVFWALLCTSATASISSILIIILLLKNNCLAMKSAKKPFHSVLSFFLGRCWPLFLTIIMSLIYVKSDIIMIGIMSGYQKLAPYSLANQIITPIISLSMPLASIFSIKISEADLSRQLIFSDSIIKFISKVKIVGVLGAMLAVIGSAILVNFFLGPSYRETIFLVAILSPYIVFTLIGYLVSVQLQSLGLFKYILILNAAAGILNIILNLVTIPLFGSFGAAFSTVISQLLALGLPLFSADEIKKRSLINCIS